MEAVYYNDYLKVGDLKKCLECLTKAHDEHLFIITHQAYELWFSQILFELDYIIPKLNEEFEDNSPVIFEINHGLSRIVEIWKILVQQFGILETMTPLDFLDFRNELAPASGFQSVQFKEIEATLGLRNEIRYHPENDINYYKHTNRGGFSEAHRAVIEKRENSVTLLGAVKAWLNRMPYRKVTLSLQILPTPSGMIMLLHIGSLFLLMT